MRGDRFYWKGWLFTVAEADPPQGDEGAGRAGEAAVTLPTLTGARVVLRPLVRSDAPGSPQS